MRKIDNKSRLRVGHIVIDHKNRKIPTTVGSRSYESLYSGNLPKSLVGTSLGQIPFGYEHRPDLIADLFYGSTLQWWKVCEVNNIFDVFEQLNTTDGIYLP